MKKFVLVLIGLMAALTWTWGGGGQTIKTYKDAATVSHVVVKKHSVAAATPGDNSYGWAWDHDVSVCDNTGQPVWDVSGAVAKWSVQGLKAHMVTDCSTADVVVDVGDANTFCGTAQTIIGCGGADVDTVTGKPYHGHVMMNASWSGWVYTDTLVGGTVHELGHVFGFGHPNGLTNADSIMGVPIPTSCSPVCARTVLSSYDKGGLRAVYR